MSNEGVLAREESHELICLLKQMIGDSNVSIETIGGFEFDGTLTRIDNELAYLSSAAILTPAGIGIYPSSAVVNLETITSINRFSDQ